MHDDEEEVELEELEDVEAEFEELPTWSNEVEEGLPKFSEEELDRVDKVSRRTELDRLYGQSVLKKLPPGTKRQILQVLAADESCVPLATSRRRAEATRTIVARECKRLSSYDLADLLPPTGVASTLIRVV